GSGRSRSPRRASRGRCRTRPAARRTPGARRRRGRARSGAPGPGPRRPRRPRTTASQTQGGGSLVDDLLEQPRRPRVVRLPDPEQGLLAELLVLLVAHDVDELVERLGLVTLRIDENELFLHFVVLDAVVQAHQLRGARHGAVAASPDAEHRRPTRLDPL